MKHTDTLEANASRESGARDLLAYLVGTDYLTETEKLHVETAAAGYFRLRRTGQAV